MLILMFVEENEEAEEAAKEKAREKEGSTKKKR